MTCEQAGRTSMAEYKLRLEGWHKKERIEWERARWQIFLLMQMHPNIKQHNKAKTPKEWIPFAWEIEKKERNPKAPVRCRLTKREKQKLMEIVSAMK